MKWSLTQWASRFNEDKFIFQLWQATSSLCLVTWTEEGRQNPGLGFLSSCRHAGCCIVLRSRLRHPPDLANGISIMMHRRTDRGSMGRTWQGMGIPIILSSVEFKRSANLDDFPSQQDLVTNHYWQTDSMMQITVTSPARTHTYRAHGGGSKSIKFERGNRCVNAWDRERAHTKTAPSSAHTGCSWLK